MKPPTIVSNADKKKALSDAYLMLEELTHCLPADGTSQKVVEARDAIRGALGLLIQKEKQAELDLLTTARRP